GPTTLIPLALRWKPLALKLDWLLLTTLPVEPEVRKIPVSLLWWVALRVTVDELVPLSWMPAAIWPLAGCPALVTVLPDTTMLLEPLIEMPYELVPVTVNPLIVTNWRAESTKPLVPPETVTVAPAAGWKTIGAPAVPEFFTVTVSLYVPDATSTVCPAVATDAALLIVQNGCVGVPWPVSEQFAPPTKSVVAAASAGGAMIAKPRVVVTAALATMPNRLLNRAAPYICHTPPSRPPSREMVGPGRAAYLMQKT